MVSIKHCMSVKMLKNLKIMHGIVRCIKFNHTERKKKN